MKNKRMALRLALTLRLVVATEAVGQDGSDNGSSKKEVAQQKFDVADGQLIFSAPVNWKKVQPKFDFYHAEFSIPKAEGDEKDGRITFSQVGGSIDANLARWVGQFKGIDASDEKQLKKTTEKVAGKNVQTIKIQGKFLDGAGPFAPKTEREGYLLLGAAIEMETGANVYIKSYGPQKTMEANAKIIRKMIGEMKIGEKVD